MITSNNSNQTEGERERDECDSWMKVWNLFHLRQFALRYSVVRCLVSGKKLNKYCAGLSEIIALARLISRTRRKSYGCYAITFRCNVRSLLRLSLPLCFFFLFIHQRIPSAKLFSFFVQINFKFKSTDKTLQRINSVKTLELSSNWILWKWFVGPWMRVPIAHELFRFIYGFELCNVAIIGTVYENRATLDVFMLKWTPLNSVRNVSIEASKQLFVYVSPILIGCVPGIALVIRNAIREFSSSNECQCEASKTKKKQKQNKSTTEMW